MPLALSGPVIWNFRPSEDPDKCRERVRETIWHVKTQRFNHSKIVVERLLSGDIGIIQLTDKNIFTVSVLREFTRGRADHRNSIFLAVEEPK